MGGDFLLELFLAGISVISSNAFPIHRSVDVAAAHDAADFLTLKLLWGAQERSDREGAGRFHL